MTTGLNIMLSLGAVLSTAKLMTTLVGYEIAILFLIDVFQILKWLETNGLFSITTLAARNMIPHLNLGKNWNILLMGICTKSVRFFKAMMIKDFQGDI